MLIYAGTKSDFMIDTENDRLETKLYENIKVDINKIKLLRLRLKKVI